VKINLTGRLYESVSTLVTKATTDYLKDETDGGWFCILQYNCGAWTKIQHVRINDPKSEIEKTLIDASLEQAKRLSRHHDHQTSRQSRDETLKQYGGAIRLSGRIISFSGLPEVWNEAIVFYAAHRLGLLDMEQVRAMACGESLRRFHQFVLDSPI
jgi:hypothetical protein